MSQSIRLLALLLIGFGLGGIALARNDTPQTPGGTWRIVSTVARNGSVEMLGDGRRYKMTRTTPTGVVTGIGIFRSGRFGIAWGVEGDYGVAIYTVGSKGTLYGQWMFSGDRRIVETDRGTRGNLDSGRGDYVVKGTNPISGAPCVGSMSITRSGEGYRLRWEIGDTLLHGVGLRTADRLTVAWSRSGQRFGVGEYEFMGEQCVGRWLPWDRSVPEWEIWSRPCPVDSVR